MEEEEDGKPKKSKVVPVDKVSLVKAEDKEGNTALHLAASEPDNMNLALHFLKILSEEGANKCTDVINVKNKDGFNALHLACSTGVSKVLSKMVELGASLSERTKSEVCVRATFAHPLHESTKDPRFVVAWGKTFVVVPRT